MHPLLADVFGILIEDIVEDLKSLILYQIMEVVRVSLHSDKSTELMIFGILHFINKII